VQINAYSTDVGIKYRRTMNIIQQM